MGTMRYLVVVDSEVKRKEILQKIANTSNTFKTNYTTSEVHGTYVSYFVRTVRDVSEAYRLAGLEFSYVFFENSEVKLDDDVVSYLKSLCRDGN